MILIAIAMVTMLGMVALSIDVIALYAARNEAQRAADAAALAAAKMLVDAGVTADPTNTGLQATAQGFATTVAQEVSHQVNIAGQPVQATDVTVTYPNNGAASFGINPTVTVRVARTNLPTFFSRIWSRAALTVSASATAEAYNPSNSSSVGSAAPIVARGVKPFLLPNCDPGAAGTSCGGTGTTFINTATGAMTRPGQPPTGVIGETFTLQSNCGVGPGCVPGPPQANEYYPVTIPPTTASACPSSFTGLSGFEEDIACSNPTPLTCSTIVGSISTTLSVDTTVLPEGAGGDPAKSGVEDLIHQQGGNGQDTLNGGVLGSGLTYPLWIQAGNRHPLALGGSINSGDNITTSDSLVTVPLYDDVVAGGAPTGPVQIIGFVQLFINQMFPGGGGPKAGSFQVTVINVSGCGSGVTGTSVFTGSSSPVPVRLVHR
jgi:Flp pilus assembly protein TadG